MSNYYLKYENTAQNLAVITNLEANALLNCSGFKTVSTQLFQDTTNLVKTKVHCVDFGGGYKQETFIPQLPTALDTYLLTEVTPISYLANKTTFDTLTNQTLYLTSTDFNNANPSRKDLTDMQFPF